MRLAIRKGEIGLSFDFPGALSQLSVKSYWSSTTPSTSRTSKTIIISEHPKHSVRAICLRVRWSLHFSLDVSFMRAGRYRRFSFGRYKLNSSPTIGACSQGQCFIHTATRQSLYCSMMTSTPRMDQILCIIFCKGSHLLETMLSAAALRAPYTMYMSTLNSIHTPKRTYAFQPKLPA